MDTMTVATMVQFIFACWFLIGMAIFFIKKPNSRQFKKYGLVGVALIGLLFVSGIYGVNAQGAPLLEVSKGFADGSTTLNVESGQNFTFRIRYRCASILQDCSGVQVTDVIPPELQYISADGPASDITDITYSGGVVTFDFVEPLGAGTTGVLEITTRFMPGTLDGTTAVNTATSVTSGGNSTSNPATATVVGGSFEMFANKNGASQLVYGQETTYTLQVCSPDTQGGIRLTNPQMEDPLPPTLTYVSASHDGVYDQGTHTITWTHDSAGGGLPDVVDVTSGCGLNVDVTVRVDPDGPDESPGNGDDPVIGNNIVNNFTIWGTPEDGSPQFSDGSGVSGLIVVPSYGDGVGKSVSTPSSYLGNEELPGGPVNYTINYNNTGMIDGTNLVLTDTVPAEIDITSIGIGPASTPGDPANAYYEVASAPGAWLPFPGNPYPSNTNVTVAVSPAAGDIVLAPGDRISGIRYEIGDVNAGGNWSSQVNGIIDAATPVPTTFNNCVDYTAEHFDFYGDPGSTNGNSCVGVTTIDPRAIPIVDKNSSNNSLQPGEVAEFSLTIANHAVAHNPVLAPMSLIDLLPADYEIVVADAGAPGGYRVPTPAEMSADAWFNMTSTDGAPTPTTTVTPNFTGTDTLLRWEWSSPYQQDPGNNITITFYGRVVAGTPPGPASNAAYILRSPATVNPLQCTAGASDYDDTMLDLDGDPVTVDGCEFTTNVTVEPILSMDSQKWVWGQLDSGWVDYGYTVAGGDVDYRIVITNTGNISATNIVVYDIFPYVGDTGVVDTQSRGSTWRPNLQAPIVDTSGLPVTISYSQQQNPCRPEVLPSGPAGCVDDWSTTPPADITSVQAIRLEFCDSGGNCAELGPDNGTGNGGSLEFTWHMVAPNDAPQDVPAWNSFGYAAEDTDYNLQLLPSEPIRVGIELQQNTLPGVSIGDYVWLDVYGDQDDGIQHPLELGVNGVRVELWDDNSGSPVFVDYRVTGVDANGDDGFYQFVEIPAGDYFVRFFPPPGYTVSPANTTANDLDSDGEFPDPTFGDYWETAVFTITPDPDPLVTTDDDWTWDQGIWLPTDYGDAPNNYPTESASLGANPELAARHIISSTIYMGAGVDPELDGQPLANAWGDDNNDGNDDEDGVTFEDYIGTAVNPLAVMTIGDTNDITVNTAVPAGTTGYLNAWIDFNGDGDWDDAGEQIATDMASTGGPLNFTVNPAASVTTGKTYARFRFSTEAGLAPTGAAMDGEVEDYAVQFVPQPVKSIIDTSEVHTTDTNNVAIGEIVRYRLEVTVPEGTMTNFTIDDNLPTGLLFIDSSSVTVSTNADTPISIENNPPIITPGTFGSGIDPVFSFGTVINNDEDVNSEFIVVEFNALVMNIAGNTNNSSSNANRRRNDFDVSYNNYTDRSNFVDTRIVEPEVSIAKSVTTTPNDAGDIVVYEIIATAGTGTYVTTAFDVNITDLLDDDLSLVSVSVTSPNAYSDNSNIGLNQVDVLISRLDPGPGQSVTITVTATVNSTAESGETIPNDADSTYTSLPGPNGTTGIENSTGSDTPGNSGEENGERDGSASPTHNDYHDTDDGDVNLAEPIFDKQVSPTTYTIGENITFDLLVTLPEGETMGLVITDDLPIGLGYISHNIVTTAVGSGGLLVADFNGTLPAPTFTDSGVDVSWDFGDTTTVGDNVTDNNSFLIQVTAVVLNVFSNQTGDTLTNQATLTYTRNGSSRDITDSEDVNLIEPVLTIDKTLIPPIPSPLDAGTVISYQIVLQHDVSSLADAYDVVITDMVPSQLIDVGHVNVTAVGITAPDFDLTGNDIRVPATGTFDLPLGATVTIIFDARIGGTAVPGQDIDNTAAAVWTSLDDSPPQERHSGSTDPDGSDYYDNGTGSATNDYETAATESLTVDGVDFLKSLTATSAGHTAGSDVTLGEIVTYVLTATVPEGNIPSLTIVDNLPPGMAYVAGTASYDDSMFSETLPDPTILPAGGSGGDVTWSFGSFNVTANNDPSDNSFTLTLQAVVLDVPGNVGISPQTILTNAATIQVGSATPTSSNPVDVTVVEPQITITKEFDKTQVTPNESTVVTLIVENTGTAAAFDMVVEDALANNTFTNITEGTTSAGWTFTAVPSGGNTIVRYTQDAGASLPIGGSATFTFSVTMHPDLVPSPPNVNNVATVIDASTLDSEVDDGDEDNATNIDEEREYTTNDNDDLEIIVPDLVLTKTNSVTHVSPGDVVIYDITVENVGGADATGVVITETVPANTTFNLANSSATWVGCTDGAAAGTICVLAVGSLASGADITVQFAVNIDDPLPANTTTVTNTAVTGDDGTKGDDPTPPNNDDDHTDTVTAAIGDYVWGDLDADGTQNDGNTSINGVTVNLYLDVDGDGIPEPGGDDGAPISTTLTINDGGGNPGYYIFDNLIPDDYFVVFVAPTGYVASPQDQGADTADSDADVVTGVTAVTTLDPGERDMTWDAGFFQPVSLGNRVWLDANADGVQDPLEIDIPGVVLRLFQADGTTRAVDIDGTQVADETTDGDGYYNFTNLPPGDYVVEVLASNWNAGNVFGTGGAFEGALGSPGFGDDDQNNSDDNGNNDGTAASAGVRSTIINLTSNLEPVDEDPQETVSNNNSDLTIDFGFYQLAAIGDYVWLDADQDGLQDIDEFGIPNVTVTLYDTSNNVISTTTTNAYGFYNFVDLTPSSYYIVVTPPPDYIITPQDANGNTDDTVDSDIDGTGTTATTTLDSNEDDPTWDAGLYIDPASIGDYVWLDQNQDGIQDGNEFGILGVTVNLYDASGNLIDTTLTDDFGYYLFDNLVPGDYYIEVVPLPGYDISTQDANGNSDDAIDSDIDATVGPTFGQTIVTTLDPNEHDPTWDAGLYNDSAAIGDLVWHDINANGIQDLGELGIENVTVVLFDVNNTAIHTTTTDTDGNYIFQYLPPGDYYVQVIPPTGYDISPQDEPSAPDANSDSDIDPATGETAMTTLDPGESDLTWDAGLYLVASLGDYVWEDSNGDGLQDETGTGINGVTVNLYVDVDGDGIAEPSVDDGAPISTTVTMDDGGGNAGYYLFDNLVPDNYFVEFVLPGGYVISPINQGGDVALDSDAGVNTGLTVVTDLESGEHDPTWDAGIYQPVSLGNWVWLDANADGVQDGSEVGIENVELALYLADGTTQASHTDGSPVANTFTDASGYYNFSNLPPGEYVVEVVVDNWSAGNVFGTGGTYEAAVGSPGAGADNQDNTDDNGNNDGIINPPGGIQSSVITLTSSGEPELEDSQETVANNDSDLTIDFGFYQYASLGDYVWVDLDVDGTQNEVNTGYNGVTVNLYVDVDGDGIAEPNGDDGTPITTTITVDDSGGNAGYYLFDNLVPGDYFVEFVMPTDYIPTLPDQGGDDTADSDAEQMTGLTPVTTLDSGEHDPTIDAGIFLPASIGDFVWLDDNRDGIQDAGEVGVGGVTVDLYDVTNTIIMTTTTAADGSYLFDNLVPGDYHIGFVPPTGYAVSPQDANANVDDAVDSDADVTSGETAVTNLIWDEHDPTWDAGIYLVAPDIAIDKSISIAWIAPNQTSVVTYTLLITNTGNIAMYNVTITDTLPNLVTYNNVSSPIVPTVNGQELVWSDITGGAAFNPGDTFQIEFEAAVSTDIGTYVNVAEVTGTIPSGFDYPEETVSDDDDAVLVIEDPSVSLDKAVVAPGIVDGFITYTIQITNTGPSVIDVLPMVDHFSGPMDYVDGTPAADSVDNVNQTVVWNDLTTTFGNLAPGQSVTIETAFRITSIDTEVTLFNSAQVVGAEDLHTNPTNEPEDEVQLINAPTAVSLSSFTAVAQGNGKVAIEWTTESESNNFGFMVYRSDVKDFATAAEIGFVPAADPGEDAPGTTYSLPDTIPNEGVWYYWLVDIDTNGIETVHGPVEVNTAGVNTVFTNFIFLPMVVKN